MSAAETSRTLLCQRDSLTRAITDLVPLCKPPVQQSRQQQKADHDVTVMFKKVLSAAETNPTLLCQRDSLTRAITDLVPLCKPPVQQSRQQQKADHDVTVMFKKVLSAAETNPTLLCERDSLTRAITDLVPLCKPLRLLV